MPQTPSFCPVGLCSSWRVCPMMLKETTLSAQYPLQSPCTNRPSKPQWVRAQRDELACTSPSWTSFSITTRMAQTWVGTVQRPFFPQTPPTHSHGNLPPPPAPGAEVHLTLFYRDGNRPRKSKYLFRSRQLGQSAARVRGQINASRLWVTETAHPLRGRPAGLLEAKDSPTPA